MPSLNIPDTFNKAKGMIRDLGLDYKKINACCNDCMIYWKDHENDTSCHVCGAPLWNEDVKENDKIEKNHKSHKVPSKVLRHFALIPRLQRLFMCSKTASSLRWHDEEHSKDGKLRHPADGEAWTEFDKCHSEFANEPRNIRLGLASDGFNPFRTINLSYSSWPVVLIPYNFPPWWCMKAEYSMLSLLIPGPFSPGNNIDMYLQPLIEELKVLWDLGVETYDAPLSQTFQMRAALLWTISDFLGYAMLSGWITKGKLACPCCNYDTNSIYLKNSKKVCYMDHHVFLLEDHKYRSNTRNFNGSIEDRPPPELLTWEQISEKLKDVNNSFGRLQNKSNNGPWKKKSIFFELPYWKHNTLRHNLDVMHIEKNIFDSIIGTLLDIPGKTKDHKNARLDLQEIDGYASNISRCVQLADKKVSGYKSHDAHFMLHYLLQVAVRSTMASQVAHPLILNEVRMGGPVQFRWMYFPERYLGKLKGYVRNKSRPEGSIAKGYLVEECLIFCSRYLHNGVETKFTRMTRNSDKCDPHEAEHEIPRSCPNVGHPIGGKRKGEAISLV
ncbi:uncharacterized protein LOC131637050 [Vicia villosa]|uniref:uncharacterized protein LOC131637050 n=1 Tax=Vicia villosa TaxID=3911 RepID=UPI00273C64AB|nr:uncharacterized protein LOC131637050 [Vicia villosa]